MELLDQLNEDQKKPVLDYIGPSFILAGPGSGKTFTIVARAAYMIQHGHIKPENILMFTFTNKAAKEIKDRVISKIGKQGERITIGTYHSICSLFLRKYSTLLGYEHNFSIFDAEDSKKILKRLLKDSIYDEYSLLSYISDQKNELKSPARAMNESATNEDKFKANIYNLYQKELMKQKAMDFDDLIYNMVILMKKNKFIQEELNNKYHYIISDESHDSSNRDLELIELLGGKKQNVCLILDDEQSIYSFRGANIQAVMQAHKRFNNMKTFVLRQNYRSTQNIVNASRSLISHNNNQLKKEIFSNNEKGTSLTFFEEYTAKDEAIKVVRLIKFLHKKHKIKYKDIAIFYRLSYLSRNIEEKLLQAGIPYEVIGGTSFYSREEVKDIISYARIIVNPFDFEAFNRIINKPKRRIGLKTVEKILEYARNKYSQPISFISAIREMEFKGVAKKGIKQFLTIYDELEKNYETDEPKYFLERIINITAYTDLINKKEKLDKAQDKLNNLIELCELANEFDTIENFLMTTSLNTFKEEEENEEIDKLQLMTIHASKGLEFIACIIIGANEKTIPHWKAKTSIEIEEERRLFYVAMTRAKKHLFFTRSKIVLTNGIPMTADCSRFIDEIDPQYISR